MYTHEVSEITNHIKVMVFPRFQMEKSDIPANKFVYSYKVVIENLGKEAVQLLNRHWIIISDEKQIVDIKGEGVIGEQPILMPGKSHEYTSWTVVDSPDGRMYGTYTFKSESGDFFDATIPRFNLIYLDPDTLH